jgi:hypothetical protein
MPNRQNEYWSRVRDCQRWAIEAETEAERQSFLQMAQTWTQLALKEAASVLRDVRLEKPLRRVHAYPARRGFTNAAALRP